MTTAIIALLCSVLGFVFGWITCAFMTADKTEDAYAEGYDQTTHDQKQKST